MKIEIYEEKNGLWGYTIETEKQKYTYTGYSSKYEAILGLIYRLEVLAGDMYDGICKGGGKDGKDNNNTAGRV